MACCGKNALNSTPLAEYARSLTNEMSRDAVQWHFPMYTVPLSTLLEMTQVEPHEVLMERGWLVKFHRSKGKAAFVSHQWAAADHPDPDFKQLRVLQEALKHAMEKLVAIPVDAISEVADSKAKLLHTFELQSEPLFIWYDYFSCPQSEDKGPEAGRGKLLDAIDSIPAYVDECSFFFALVPVVEDLSRSKLITPFTWQERGWCRLERICRELSTNESWVIVKSSTELELVASATASILNGSGPVGEGIFTVLEDRLKLAPVLLSAIKRKMQRLLKSQDLAGYRALLNRQTAMLRGFQCDPLGGFVPDTEDSSSTPVKHFCHQNGFRSIHEKDRYGWQALHYAALKGDPYLVQDLLALQADPNCGTKRGHEALGLEIGSTPLTICCLFQHTDAARVLISAKSAVRGGGTVYHPLGCAALTNNAESIQILCDAGCSPRDQNTFGFSAMAFAGNVGALASMKELLQQTGHVPALDPTRALQFAMYGCGGSAEVVQWLVDLKADVNDQNFATAFQGTRSFRAIYTLKVLQHKFHKVTSATKRLYHVEGATALMMALLTSQYEGAAALIAAGARLDLRNARGWKAADFMRGRSVPDLVATTRS
ncbi:unnamed protein product [Durusdinium trenchii]|uniref:Uncharacterized protein n=2 Tax=Durusdinium trenchii TaxID=1381693 RepID=A0ABP0J6B4_9DINO